MNPPKPTTIEHPSRLSRRSFLAAGGLLTAAALVGPRRLFAQESIAASTSSLAGLVTTARKKAEAAKITIEKLRGNISVLSDDLSGNIAVLHGKDGKFLVDAGLAGSRRQITEALAGISTDPIRHVVNTHWHFDHTDGNEWLRGAGATIIAHENVRKRMAEATRVELWDFTFPSSPAAALPTFTLRTKGAKEGRAGATLYLNGTVVRLDTCEPAHTDGDTVVEFTDADIIHLGDLWWNGLYPFIDYGVGGSINGVIRATEAILARVTDKTIVVPGHGPVGTRSNLAEYRDMLVTVRDKVATLKARGRSVEEVAATNPTGRYDARWGGSVVTPGVFTVLVYAGV